MDREALATAAVLAVALLPLLALARRSASRPFRIGAIVLWGASCVGLAWTAAQYRPVVVEEAAASGRPIQAPEDGFTTSDACRACHPREHGSWHASYHRTMTQVATPQAVRGRFDGAVVEVEGRSYRMTRRGDEFWVAFDELIPGGRGGRRRVERPVVLTTGSHHQQAYWVPAGEARKVALFPLFYHFEERRWITVDSAFVIPPGLSQITEGGGQWNVTCNKCHATRSRPRLLEEAGIDTQVVEFGIACEACHGPGEAHARNHRDPRRRYRLHFDDEPDPSIVEPSHLPARLGSQVCGQCHGAFSFRGGQDALEWADRGFSYRPGQRLEDSRAVVRNSLDRSDPVVAQILEGDPGYMRSHFWPDGAIRVTGREYNGLIESPCYERGDPVRGILSCLSCHSMHEDPNDPRPLEAWAVDQLKPALDGDESCTGCHAAYLGDAALVAHSHHEPASSGSRCQNCHMPYTTYGLLKASRSHTIDSPDVAASLATGRPNACNLCHLDATLSWTARYLDEWYETPPPPLAEDERTVAASLLWLLKGDAGQRALMAWHLGWRPALEISGSDWVAPYLAQLLVDEYAAVRFIAGRSLRSLPAYADLEYDFLATRAERAAAARRAQETWAARPAPAMTKIREHVLVQANRSLRGDVIRRLLAERDTSPLYLNE